MATPSKISLDAETFTVPLNKLSLYISNVRRANAETDIEALADNIAAEGLLQNLGVFRVENREGKPTEQYAVVIGGRRFRALKLLVKTKRLAANAPIRCALVPVGSVTSAGLAEKLHRVAMHPADAYVAFAQMASEGLEETDIAVRFGITPQTVQKRLRLGRLSPTLLDALRANTVSEQVAQAFAITTDTQAQDRVFEAVRGSSWINPATVRKMLTEGEVPIHDRRVLLIGLDAYEQAGGEVRRDLFSSDTSGTTLMDAGLVDRLVLDHLAAEGNRLRAEGWSNVSVSAIEPEDMRAYYPAPSIRVELTPEEQARLTALGQEYDTLAEQGDAEDLSDQDEARLEEIENEIETLQAGTVTYPDEVKAQARTFVFLGDRGLRIVHGLPRAGVTDPVARIDQEAADRALTPAGRAANDDRPALSAALAAELQAHRTAGLQAQVADRPGLALRLVVHSLLLGSGFSASRSVAKITGHTPYLKQACPTIETSPAFRALADCHERRGDHEPGEHAELLPWLLSLDDSQVMDLLAPLVASTVDAGTADWTVTPDCMPAQVATAAALDMTAYWTATPENYFSRVSKAQIGQAVRDAGAGPFATDGKKAAVSVAAARLVEGTGWLPTMLRVPTIEQQQTAASTQEDEEESHQMAAE